MMIGAEIPEGRERLNPYPTLRFRLQNDSTFRLAATSAGAAIQRNLTFLFQPNSSVKCGRKRAVVRCQGLIFFMEICREGLKNKSGLKSGLASRFGWSFIKACTVLLVWKSAIGWSS